VAPASTFELVSAAQSLTSAAKKGWVTGIAVTLCLFVLCACLCGARAHRRDVKRRVEAEAARRKAEADAADEAEAAAARAAAGACGGGDEESGGEDPNWYTDVTLGAYKGTDAGAWAPPAPPPRGVWCVLAPFCVAA
jgi:hypothetical protein